jgi:hypothetical protein
MALVIENGTLVAGADSWVTRPEFIAYAAALGLVVPDTDATDAPLRKACRFIGQHESRLLGGRVTRDQSTAYPRVNLTINGWGWQSNEIPATVKECQMEYALDIRAGFDPWNPAANPSLIKKRARVEGAVEVEYAVGNATGQSAIRTSRADALLASLLDDTGFTGFELVRR